MRQHLSFTNKGRGGSNQVRLNHKHTVGGKSGVFAFGCAIKGKMRKSSGNILVSLTLALCICILAILMPVKSNAASTCVRALTADKSYYSFDITGDGKKDHFKIVRSNRVGTGAYSKFKILVNGKKAYEVSKIAKYKDTVFPSFIYRTVRAKLIALGNGRKYLFLYCPYEEGGGMFCSILQYKNGKFVKAVDMIKYIDRYGEFCSGDILGVSGDTIRVKLSYSSYTLGRSDYEMSFRYTNGKLKQDAVKGKLLRAHTDSGNTKTFRVGRTVRVFNKPVDGKVSFRLYRGDRVTIDQCRITLGQTMFRVKCGNKVGWIYAVMRGAKTPFTNVQLF